MQYTVIQNQIISIKIMTKAKKIIYSVFRCKQFVWMDNVAKLPVDGSKWEKKYVKV